MVSFLIRAFMLYSDEALYEAKKYRNKVISAKQKPGGRSFPWHNSVYKI